MKRRYLRTIAACAAAVVLTSAAVWTHPVTFQGTVLAVEAARLHVKTVDARTRKETPIWFAVTKDSKVRRGNRAVAYADANIAVGERIVIVVNTDVDIPNFAEEVRLGTAPAAAAIQKATATAKAPEGSIVLTTKPAPPVTGENEFTVVVKAADGKPVVGADVSVTLSMAAMPAMNMPAMKNAVALKSVSDKPMDAGKYTGKGQVMMGGQWSALVTAKVKNQVVAEKTLPLTAK